MGLTQETPHSATIVIIGDNPDLLKMPDRPTLADFFHRRLNPGAARHLLQSARIAWENGMAET